MPVTWFAEQAMLPGGLAHDVSFEVDQGRFTAVRPRSAAPDGARRLPGLALPGLANAHSHAYQRALRGRLGPGTTARDLEVEYESLLARLDPDSYHLIVRAAFAEMVLGGVTTVGEFHRLHHQPNGRPYGYGHVMSDVVIEAAAAAGLRLTLFDTLWLSGGLTPAGHRRLRPHQHRFCDGTVDAWSARLRRHPEGDRVRVGAGLQSVGAVPRAWLRDARDAADDLARTRPARRRTPVQVHVATERSEVEASLGYYGATPTELLVDAGLVGPSFTAVNATHLSDKDVGYLGGSRTNVALCPSSERDGPAPSRRLLDAGTRVALGSGRAAVLDLFEEARVWETKERLESREQSRLGAFEIRAAMLGHDTLGWPDAGQLRAGARADVVALDLDSVRTAGVHPSRAFLVAAAADVIDVAVDGDFVVEDRRHVLGDVGALLREATDAVWGR